MLSVKFFQTVYAHQALLARLPSTIVLRGYPPTVPLAPHAHWGCGAPIRRQASLGHGDACKGCLQGGCLQGDASKGDICKGVSARDVAMGDVAMGVSSAYGLLPVVYQEATC